MVGLDLGKSSNKRQKKLRSEVWNDFEKYTDENGKDWAKCNICKKPFNGSSKMGTTHLKNHFKSCSKNKSNEGGGSASGDKPAEDSVMDQQLNHLDKSNYEGGGSASGDKPAENSVMDPQLNRLDMVKMLIKRWRWIEPFPNSIEAADLINVYKEEKEKLRIYFEKLPCRLSLMIYMDQLLYEILYDRMKEIFKYITGNGNFRIAIDRATSSGKKVTTGNIPTEQADLEVMDAEELVDMGFGLKEAFLSWRIWRVNLSP
ncbi:hypothetical protein LWI29_032020 [Acer saccharum]|uniref:BED-type domain-containing protein n=1 Tax=Acer saccharum TaxID=4024 RepID=A0AA39VIS0_ACESA|nr:hypothetical protein LWI29_032020 [Acer saccharum]